MKKINLALNCPPAPANYNRGERVEWNVGYTLTGHPSERNNRAAQNGGDVEGWQVKSPKASLTGRDNCDGYIFGFADAEFFYEMTCEEFAEFAQQFTYMDHDSKSGKSKARIKNDSKVMRAWLEERATA